MFRSSHSVEKIDERYAALTAVYSDSEMIGRDEPGDERAIGGVAAPLGQAHRDEAAPRPGGTRAGPSATAPPRQPEVDHRRLRVLGRVLPLRDVLEDDAVEQEERAEQERDRPGPCRRASSLRRTARPRWPGDP